MKFPPMVFHTLHVDFESWLRGSSVGDLRARLGTLRRQAEDPEVRDDAIEFAIIFWSLKHVEVELERRAKVARRRVLPPASRGVTSMW